MSTFHRAALVSLSLILTLLSSFACRLGKDVVEVAPVQVQHFVESRRSDGFVVSEHQGAIYISRQSKCRIRLSASSEPSAEFPCRGEPVAAYPLVLVIGEHSIPCAAYEQGRLYCWQRSAPVAVRAAERNGVERISSGHLCDGVHCAAVEVHAFDEYFDSFEFGLFTAGDPQFDINEPVRFSQAPIDDAPFAGSRLPVGNANLAADGSILISMRNRILCLDFVNDHSDIGNTVVPLLRPSYCDVGPLENSVVDVVVENEDRECIVTNTTTNEFGLLQFSMSEISALSNHAPTIKLSVGGSESAVLNAAPLHLPHRERLDNAWESEEELLVLATETPVTLLTVIAIDRLADVWAQRLRDSYDPDQLREFSAIFPHHSFSATATERRTLILDGYLHATPPALHYQRQGAVFSGRVENRGENPVEVEVSVHYSTQTRSERHANSGHMRLTFFGRDLTESDSFRIPANSSVDYQIYGSTLTRGRFTGLVWDPFRVGPTHSRVLDVDSFRVVVSRESAGDEPLHVARMLLRSIESTEANSSVVSVGSIYNRRFHELALEEQYLTAIFGVGFVCQAEALGASPQEVSRLRNQFEQRAFGGCLPSTQPNVQNMITSVFGSAAISAVTGSDSCPTIELENLCSSVTGATQIGQADNRLSLSRVRRDFLDGNSCRHAQ